jgi:nucleoside-diphosphate-sugar epimerase
MAVRDDRSDVKQTTTGFRGPLMVQSLTSAKSKFLSLELVQILIRVVGFKGEVFFDKSKPEGPKRKLMDVSRLSSMGWTYNVGLEEGLKKA